MFGGVVLTVDEPECVKLVGGAVVKVKPVVESHLPPCHLQRCGPGETLERVHHVASPSQEEGTHGTEDGVDENGASELVDVLVVDHVTTSVLLVKAPILCHVVVEALDHELCKVDEGDMIDDPRWSPVHGVLRKKVVPSGVNEERNGSSAENENVLLPHWSHRRRTPKFCVCLPTLVCCVRPNVERTNVFPKVLLHRGLEVPCRLRPDSVDLVEDLARGKVCGDGALVCSTGGFRSWLVTSILRWECRHLRS